MTFLAILAAVFAAFTTALTWSMKQFKWGAYLEQDQEPITIPAMPTNTPASPPELPVEPVKASPSLLDQFCTAIALYEGGYQEGSRPFRNCNPGDLRQLDGPPYNWGATGKDSGNFLTFPTWQGGYNGLKAMVRYDASGHSSIYKPTDTIQEYFAKYAPSDDNNDPDKYAEFVAVHCGLSTTSPISVLLG